MPASSLSGYTVWYNIRMDIDYFQAIVNLNRLQILHLQGVVIVLISAIYQITPEQTDSACVAWRRGGSSEPLNSRVIAVPIIIS